MNNKMITMYEIMILSRRLGILEEEVLLCLAAQDFELSWVACVKANSILYNVR